MKQTMKEVLFIGGVWVLYTIVFSIIFAYQENYEFLFYVATEAIAVALIVIARLRGVSFTQSTLIALVIWGFLHFLGGVSLGEEGVIYTFMVVDIIGDPYNILKYDQVVHFLGSIALTFAVYDILRRHLDFIVSRVGIVLVCISATLGFGALNEIIEFIATLLFTHVNVGGYVNNSLDHVFNLTGALVAGSILLKRLARGRVEGGKGYDTKNV